MDTENKEVKELLNELKSINNLDNISDLKQTNDIGLNMLKNFKICQETRKQL